MPNRKLLGQIVERVPAVKGGKEQDYLENTIFLESSVEPKNREETVRLYYFAKTLKKAFEEILVAFSESMGRGFWLTAEYGVGKSHFLATLASLLIDTSDMVWDRIHDADIRNYRFKFQKRRLFPIVAGLRGKTAITPEHQITLLGQIEKEIDEWITRLGLEQKISITPVTETLNLFDGFNGALQGAISTYIQQKSTNKASDLRKSNPERFADLVRRFFKDQNLPFEPPVSINDRLRYLYQQIVNPRTGFTGLLIIIDEFESWLSQRPITQPQGMFDSNVLQALTEILPKQYGCDIFTVVASQTDIPAQLQGRFTSLPLLAGSGAERDYHVICAYRVRRYLPGMEPEAKLYYHDFYDEFFSYKNETEETFLETFPFHPLSYETIRRLTSSVQDMPGVRLGLNIFYDVMKSQTSLSADLPVTLHQVYKNSSSLQNALASPRFADSLRKYLDAVQLLSRVFPDEEDRIIAEGMLTILYLQFVVSGTETIPMTAAELADATLTRTEAITGEQRVHMLLAEMSSHVPQLEFDRNKAERGARFVPRDTGPTPQQVLDEFKQLHANQEPEIAQCWEKLLFASLSETRGQKALFTGQLLDKAWKDKVTVNQIEYEGEVLVTRSWRPELSMPIQDSYVNFRLIYLLNPVAASPALQDARIVAVEPPPLSDKLKDWIVCFLASDKMMDEYDPKKQKGPEAAQFRTFAETEHFDSLSKILQYQLEPFQKGKPHTRDGLNLDLLSAMSKPTPDQRHAALLNPTLLNAYYDFSMFFESAKIEKPVVNADPKNLFLGLVQGDTSKAVRSTLEQKAVGLGLALPENPRKLDATHSKLFQVLNERLAQKPSLIIWPLMKELAGCPYGVPPQLFASLLLVYVRSRSVPSQVEVQLNPNHSLANRSGQHVSINRITRSNVVELQYQSDMERHFESLSVVAGIGWPDIYPVAKVIFPEAKIVTQPSEIDNQISAFLAYLKNQLLIMKSTLEQLNALADSLSDRLSDGDGTVLQNTIDLFGVEDLEAFEAKRRSIGGGAAEMQTTMERAADLRRLSSRSTQIVQLYGMLKGVDEGGDQDLELARTLLLARYKFHSMIGNDTATAALLNDTEAFLKRVQNAEEVHGQRMKEKLVALKLDLEKLAPIVEALGRLNQLSSLGAPIGHGLADRVDVLTDTIDKELSGKSQAHMRLSYEAPEKDVRDLDSRLKQALQGRAGILRSQLEKAVKEKGGMNQLKVLLDLLQLNKLGDLSLALTPTLLETIENILEEARTHVIRSAVLEEMASQFPAIGKDDIEPFLKYLRSLLEKEFIEKEQQQPGKTVLLGLK